MKKIYLLLLFQFLYFSFSQSQEVKKKVVIEGYVTAPAVIGGYAPKAYQTFDKFGKNNKLEDYEIIVVHGNCYNCSGVDFDTLYDGMYHDNYSKGMDSLGACICPSVTLNRNTPLYPMPYKADSFQEAVDMCREDKAFASIDVNADYDVNTRDLNISTAINFVELKKNFRLALVLTEYKVQKEDDIEYSQWNFYSRWFPDGVNQGSNITDSVEAYGVRYWAHLPRVSSSDMVHPHVARAILPNFYGDSTSLPSTVEKGKTYTHSFETYTVPEDFKADRMRAIVLLLDENGKINNANGTWINGNPMNLGADNEFEFTIYPNPAKNSIFIRQTENRIKSYTIFNSFGKVLLNGSINTPEIDIQSLPKGSYFIMLENNKTNECYFRQFIK
jgi:hypothetical protein